MQQSAISHFASQPGINISRSRFKRASQLKTTFREGDLVPLYLDEILPGDTVSMDMANVTRMTTPVFPVMDNAYFDTFWFFVPNRLVWNHWKEFMGENTAAPWAQTTEYAIPKASFDDVDFAKVCEPGTLYDYFGLPFYDPTLTGFSSIPCSDLPIRGYWTIYNEFFRDQNLEAPVGISTGDSGMLNLSLYEAPARASKYHDYFTSALPAPQKGPSVLLPLSGLVPVITGDDAGAIGPHLPVTFSSVLGSTSSGGFLGIIGSDGEAAVDSSFVVSAGSPKVYPNNLYAALDALPDKPENTINALRLAFQTQKLLEADARGGTRYTEVLWTHFGVQNPDFRLQRPEYLGGDHSLLNMDQVVQSSGTASGTTPQGNVSGMSKSVIRCHPFTHSFTEHGYLFCLGVVRTQRTYQQGYEKHWTRSSRLDFYFPELAHIGEQPIYNREIYAQGLPADDEVFGYQEAWAEYRYKPSKVTGMMRSGVTGTLDAWHYADYYDALPILSDDWIKEDSAAFDRTIAIQTETPDQFVADFLFDADFTRPMPVYSVPGLADHF